jgi:hypothetical protein
VLIEGAGQLQRVERISAGDFVYPSDDRPQQCPSQRRIGSIRVAGARGYEHTDAALQSAGREVDDGLARRIQPLHVVDGDQHRRLHGQQFEHRPKGCRRDAFVGGGTLVAAQQYPVECDPLYRRQSTVQFVIDVVQQVGQHSERQPCLGDRRARRKHSTTPDSRTRSPCSVTAAS